MERIAVFHGTQDEAFDLCLVVAHNCDCEQVKRRCAAHTAVLNQRFIDGLLFGRWLRRQLELEEGLDSLVSAPREAARSV